MLQYIYKIPKARYAPNLAEFRRMLELDTFLNTPVRAFSLGRRMRADISAALFHNPKLLFLDEPTIGLDVIAKERIHQFILHNNRQYGTTILLTTHDLSDVEKLCERVKIIDHGRLLFDGQLQALKDRFGGKRQLLVDFAEEYLDPIVSGADICTRQGMCVTYEFEGHRISASELIGRLSTRYRIQDLEVHGPESEDTVRRIYEERLLEIKRRNLNINSNRIPLIQF